MMRPPLVMTDPAAWMDAAIPAAQRARELQDVFDDLDAHPWPDDIAPARVLYDQMGPPVPNDIRAEDGVLAGVPARWLYPPSHDPSRVMLFLHGGGYVYGSLDSHAGMAAELARAAGCIGVQLHYRLAPEHPHPAAVEDALAAYCAVLDQGYAASAVSLVGDSAGGGLVVALLLVLKQRQLPLPGAVACLSPWVDLLLRGESYQTRAHLDPMVERKVVELVREQYLGLQDPTQVTASPILGDLTGLPPMLVQVGELEILYSDAEMLAEKAHQCGVEVTFEVWPAMVHVWHLYYPMLTAGREAISRVGAFLRQPSARPTASKESSACMA
ncbi:alpha/beta hydrolase [Leeia sp.]|uniref:alpha/beta hydrolase n=1 Tax=Leeia sp. TaxID=2884678 RepID=UPI0035AFD758